jgi:hypothetical protein
VAPVTKPAVSTRQGRENLPVTVGDDGFCSSGSGQDISKRQQVLDERVEFPQLLVTGSRQLHGRDEVRMTASSSVSTHRRFGLSK